MNRDITYRSRDLRALQMPADSTIRIDPLTLKFLNRDWYLLSGLQTQDQFGRPLVPFNNYMSHR